MNIMTTFVIPTTPSTGAPTSVPSEYQFTKTSHVLRTPHPQRSQRIFSQKFNSASPTPVPLEAQFTRTTPMLPTTPSSETSSPAPLDVQFTWTIPMLPTTPSTTNSAHSQSEVLAPESSSIRRSKASRKTPFKSLFFKKIPLKNSVRNSPFLHNIKHYRSTSFGPNKIPAVLAIQHPNSSFLHGKFPKPNVSFLHLNKVHIQTSKTLKSN